MAWITKFGGTAGALHSQHQDQERLVQMTVIKLRSLAQAIGNEVVSDLELMKYGGLWCHKRGSSCWSLVASDLSLAEFLLETAELVQGALPTTGLLGRRDRGSRGGVEWGSDRWPEPDTADMEIFLEAIQLEEIGKLERPHITARLTDFLLQIANDLDQIALCELSAQELIPKPLPVKTQREVLTGETAIGLVQLLDLRVHRWS